MYCESNDLQDLLFEVIWYNMIEIFFLFVIYYRIYFLEYFGII